MCFVAGGLFLFSAISSQQSEKYCSGFLIICEYNISTELFEFSVANNLAVNIPCSHWNCFVNDMLLRMGFNEPSIH